MQPPPSLLDQPPSREHQRPHSEGSGEQGQLHGGEEGLGDGKGLDLVDRRYSHFTVLFCTIEKCAKYHFQSLQLQNMYAV